MLNDLRYALRMMRRSPLFTVTVVLTVALAISANTAIFSVVNAVMLRPLPFREPDRLVQVAEKNDTLSLPTFSASLLNLLSWSEQSPKSFEQIAALGFETCTLTGAGEPEQLAGNRISPALLPMLGLAPLAGRVFTAEEEKPGAAPVAMLGAGLWKRHLVYGITVRDPATHVAVAIVLGSVALAACALPARRAARIDPMVALRCG